MHVDIIHFDCQSQARVNVRRSEDGVPAVPKA
jgi:hypothetical protein